MVCGAEVASGQHARRLRDLAGPAIAPSSIFTNPTGTLAACLRAPDYRYAASSVGGAPGRWLLIDGIALDPAGGHPLPAQTLLELLDRRGIAALQDLNGEYLVLACLGEETWLVSDRMGLRQHCVARPGRLTAVAPTPAAALSLAGADVSVDTEAMLTFLCSNKLRLDEQTIYRHCETMPAASVYRLAADGQLLHSRYWSLSYAPDANITYEAIVEEAEAVFRRAVTTRLTAGAKVGLTLTGGLDSRLMAGAVPLDQREGIVCSTMGTRGCDEVELAKLVARTGGYDYREVTIDAATALSPSGASYLDGEDVDLLIQNCWHHFLRANADRDVLLHGLDLDVTLGGIYLTKELAQLTTFDQLTDYAVRHALSCPLADLVKLFRPEVMTNAAENIRGRIAGMLAAAREENLLNTYDHFILQSSMHRVILQRYRTIRRYIDTLTPMYDRHLIDLYCRIPPDMRAQHRVFQPVLLRICPEFANIPYQRTGLPPSVPRHFWAEGQGLEVQREELLRRIARETAGACHLPVQRYYTNVDEWLRFDPLWMQACDELLRSTRSLIRQYYLFGDRVDELIAEHRAHKRSNMKIILILMSAELVLRKAAGTDLASLFESFASDPLKSNP